jgi:hypothetical protein
MPIYNQIINQKGTPAFYSDIFANRPAFGYAGRVFISTDTGAIYEDTGTAWTLIADAGAGTTGTLQQVTTNGNTTTLGIVVQGININDGAGTGANNIAIGTSSLGLNTTGYINVALGYTALQNNTTGFANIGIGQQTLLNNTTGNANVGVGNAVLSGNVSGSNNTAVGNGALSTSGTASNNTAIGYQSLAANTTGASNTAIGVSALSGNTTASFNTAIGSISLSANTTGANNTAIGSGSLSLNTTGINNTAIGQSSLAANITGSYNVGLGVGTLGNNLGSYNVGIGHSSLNAVTTGTNNSAIGYASGSAITTGSNNTIIGGYGGTTTLASNIVLSDGAGNVRLFSDANGLIGINQAVGSTIGGQLDIHSTQTYALVLNGLTTSNAYTAFSNNNVGKWRIGNTYNAGANSFDIYNLGTSSTALSFNSTTNGATFSSTLDTGDTITLTKSQNAATSIKILNTNVGSSATQSIFFDNDARNNLMTLRGYSNAAGSSIPDISDSVLLRSNGAGGLTISAQEVTGVIRFSTGGVAERMRISSAGNLLINSTTDDTINKLQVTGSGVFSGQLNIIVPSGAAKMQIGDGSVSGGALLNLGGISAGKTWFISSNYNIGGGLEFIQSTTNGGTTPSSNAVFSIASTGAATLSNLAGTGSRAVLADANGLLSAPVSDISVKQNINTIGYGLNEILKMNPVWFNYNDEYKNYGEGRQNGNIAQDMEAIIPEAVFITPSTGKMGINYDQLHAVYIKAIQELKAEIDALKNN